MNIVFDKLKYEELKQYKELIDECFDGSSEIEKYREMYSDNNNYEILIAKVNDEMVGSITLLKIDLFTFSFQPMLELFNVCVKPSYRKNKIGTYMMDYVIKYAKDNEYNSIVLTCLEDNEPIHKFYESVGFIKANSRKYAMYFR